MAGHCHRSRAGRGRTSYWCVFSMMLIPKALRLNGFKPAISEKYNRKLHQNKAQPRDPLGSGRRQCCGGVLFQIAGLNPCRFPTDWILLKPRALMGQREGQVAPSHAGLSRSSAEATTRLKM